MQLTETVKLYPNKYQTELIKATMTEYISTVNHLVLDAINGRAITKITTADVNVALPSALCNFVIERHRHHEDLISLDLFYIFKKSIIMI